MGIGFVIIAWGIIFVVLFIPLSFLIGFALRWKLKKKISFGRSMLFGIFPFILLVYGFFAFVGYALYCEMVRKVDPGIGDGWQVPVGNNYYLCMIDVPDNGYLMSYGCSGSPIIDGITEINVVGNLVVGRAKNAFIFDSGSGKLTEMDATSKAFQAHEAELLNVNDFYIRRRWNFLDIIAVFIILIPGVCFIKWWYEKIIAVKIQ